MLKHIPIRLMEFSTLSSVYWVDSTIIQIILNEKYLKLILNTFPIKLR